MIISTLRYDVLRQLCFMMDPLVTVGSDFTTFAAQIGFCSTYIRFVMYFCSTYIRFVMYFCSTYIRFVGGVSSLSPLNSFDYYAFTTN